MISQLSTVPSSFARQSVPGGPNVSLSTYVYDSTIAYSKGEQGVTAQSMRVSHIPYSYPAGTSYHQIYSDAQRMRDSTVKFGNESGTVVKSQYFPPKVQQGVLKTQLPEIPGKPQYPPPPLPAKTSGAAFGAHFKAPASWSFVQSAEFGATKARIASATAKGASFAFTKILPPALIAVELAGSGKRIRDVVVDNQKNQVGSGEMTSDVIGAVGKEAIRLGVEGALFAAVGSPQYLPLAAGVIGLGAASVGVSKLLELTNDSDRIPTESKTSPLVSDDVAEQPTFQEQVDDQPFIKNSRYGNLTRQLILGQVQYNDIPPKIREEMDAELSTPEGLEFRKWLREKANAK